jgi:hypothetical protein
MSVVDSGGADVMARCPLRAVHRAVIVLAGLLLLAPTVVEADSTKALVLLVDIDVADVSGTDTVSFTKSARDDARVNVSEAIARFVATHGRFEILPTPTLTDAETASVRKHAALAVRSAAAGLTLIDAGDGEAARIQADFPYSVGSGLRAIADKTGADAAFIVQGLQLRQSLEHAVLAKVVPLLTAAKGLSTSVTSVDEAPGIYVVLVDLRSGKLRWANRAAATVADPSLASGADRLVGRLLETYPRSPVRDRESAP